MKSERLLLRDARSLTFDASSFKMAETLLEYSVLIKIHQERNALEILHATQWVEFIPFPGKISAKEKTGEFIDSHLFPYTTNSCYTQVILDKITQGSWK